MLNECRSFKDCLSKKWKVKVLPRENKPATHYHHAN
jgi:hypothetical protein